ncbi:unnamed protein product [Gongylonema pulchrum]|uniref:PINc domain-containing protein n=1 Tax=Gongylonema pulchrum TaxID=637853 RepID=A0A183D9T1_9BILA|nr:unnamed protein product [Gongylonema pulchrum]
MGVPGCRPIKQEKAEKPKKSITSEEESAPLNNAANETAAADCGVPSVSEPCDELMEVDENIIEGLSNEEEPMEIDFVVGEVQAFRRDYYFCPDIISKDVETITNSTKCMGGDGAGKSAIVIVFDTSCLLQDTTLLTRCIQRLYHAVIPYTVVRELDGLKKSVCFYYWCSVFAVVSSISSKEAGVSSLILYTLVTLRLLL